MRLSLIEYGCMGLDLKLTSVDTVCIILKYLSQQCSENKLKIPKKEIVEYVQKFGKSRSTAYYNLNKLESAGIIKTQEISVNGRRVHIVELSYSNCRELEKLLRECKDIIDLRW